MLLYLIGCLADADRYLGMIQNIREQTTAWLNKKQPGTYDKYGRKGYDT